MHSAIKPESLPGLKYRHIGLGLIKEAGKYIKKKSKDFLKKQIKSVAIDVANDVPLKTALKKKAIALAKVGGKVKKGKRKRVTKIRKRTTKIRKNKSKKIRKVSPVKRRKNKKKSSCPKNTIFS